VDSNSKAVSKLACITISELLDILGRAMNLHINTTLKTLITRSEEDSKAINKDIETIAKLAAQRCSSAKIASFILEMNEPAGIQAQDLYTRRRVSMIVESLVDKNGGSWLEDLSNKERDDIRKIMNNLATDPLYDIRKYAKKAYFKLYKIEPVLIGTRASRDEFA
jgi:hypothetical protein